MHLTATSIMQNDYALDRVVANMLLIIALWVLINAITRSSGGDT